jgi:hypothetical protein
MYENNHGNGGGATQPLKQEKTPANNWVRIASITFGCLVLVGCLTYITYRRMRARNVKQ